MGTVDWSSFFPDLIVGVVTGGVVGLALYLFEWSRRRAEARSQALYGWQLLAPRIERISAQPLGHDTTNYVGFGATIQRIRDIADGYPLEQWQQELKRPDIAALLDLLSEFDSLEVAGEKAERTLETAAYFKGIDSEIGGMVCIVARSQTYADTDEQLLAMFAAPNDFMLKFVPLALSLREHEPYAEAEQNYMGAKIRTRAAQVEYVNAVRLARSEEFDSKQDRDDRRQLLRDRRLHPIKTARRERQNKRARREHD